MSARIFVAGVVAWLLAGALPAAAGDFPPPFYSAKPIRATVVDHLTGQPIEGAVVVAKWEARPMSGRGPRLQVSEAVTDAQGRFSVPGWGPKPRPPLTELQDRSPQIVIFKHGYVPVELRNPPKADFAFFRSMADLPAREASLRMPYEGSPNEPIQESFWDGMAIRLEPFTGDLAAWLNQLRFLTAPLGDDAKDCPKMFQALRAERRYFTSVPREQVLQVEVFFTGVDLQIENARRK